MSVTVLLTDIVDELEMINDQTEVFFNIRTGEFVYISEFDDPGEAEELQDEIEAHEEDYVRLPSQYDIHEYRIMEHFIDSLEDENIRSCLYRAIRGRGAFRCFKDMICELGVRKAWFAFKTAALREIAIAWCNDNAIVYTEG